MEKARAACLACDHIDPAGHGGMVSYEAAGERVVERLRDKSISTHGRGFVSTLPEEVEEAVLMLFHALTALDPFDALLALHVANGGTCATFGPYLAQVIENLSRYNLERTGFRATAHARWKRLKKKFGAFAALQSWPSSARS